MTNFRIEAEGYNRAQVDEYVAKLKEEYKKVFEYAKTTEANNEKLKVLCRNLSDENKALKANQAAAPATAVPSEATASVEKIASLIEELAKENAALKDIL